MRSSDSGVALTPSDATGFLACEHLTSLALEVARGHREQPDVEDDQRDLIQRKQAVIRVEGSLPAVMGDPERVVQLLANLVSNGLKYNNNPSPRWSSAPSPPPSGRPT